MDTIGGTTNTFQVMEADMKEAYADGKPKRFKKIKASMKKEKCSCGKDCGCKKKK